MVTPETHPTPRKYFYVAGAETTASADRMKALGTLLLFCHGMGCFWCILGCFGNFNNPPQFVGPDEVWAFPLFAAVFTLSVIYVYKTLPWDVEKHLARIKAEREHWEERKRSKELSKELGEK